MKCDICHENDAILFVRQEVSGSVTEMHLCSECASKKGLLSNATKTGLSLEGLLTGLVKNNRENKSCPCCGKKLSQIKKQKKAGCPECYNVFKNEIKEILQSMGITQKYTGSIPNVVPGYKDNLTYRILLQDKLQKAIQNEDYEKAAVYRDQLKLLDKESVQEGESDE